jgi:alginate O-acetyltransferase complex protein AlgJ
MAVLDRSLPAGEGSRERIARIEVGHTAVTPATARLLVATFLFAIAIVPIVEWLRMPALKGEGEASPWSHLIAIPSSIGSSAVAAANTGAWNRLVSVNRAVLAGLSGFERALENQSVLGRSLRPPAQAAITRWLGAGNERVYRGLGGWLFYRPDVDYLMGRGFLDAAQLARRITAAEEWEAPPQPDPRTAIVRFNEDLAARGATLIVMPTPPKPGIHHEMLAGASEDVDDVVTNASYHAFVDDLVGRGVLVFDPSEMLAAARRSGPQYLASDTHWRPEAMEMVADRLSAVITTHVDLPAVADPGYRVERVETRNTGDTARMLDLPDVNRLYPPEAVWLRRILRLDGSLWRSTPSADVLVLGDSFSNIYSLDSMDWGTSAGFVEQLAYSLRRPIDRLVQNDEGAFATRAAIARDPARLAGKRVVVHQFAARELAFGDWRVIPLP